MKEASYAIWGIFMGPRLLPVLALFALPCLALPGAAAQGMAPAQMTEELDVIARFFLPGAAVTDMVRGGCSVAYRTKLSRNADDLALERDMPGIHDKVVAAASAHCDAGADAMLARMHDRIRADWRASTNPADLHRLAVLFAPMVRETDAIRLQPREGEMMKDTARRIDDAPERGARFEAAQRAFAGSPGGGALLDRVSAYQDHLRDEINSNEGELGTLVRGGLAAGHRAANAYAREKGASMPYPGQ